MEVCVVHAAFEDVPKIVALVDIPDDILADTTDSEALEYAYRWTQNVEGSWSRSQHIMVSGIEHNNPDFNWRVKCLAELPVHRGEVYGLRSTSVGDYMSVVTQFGELRRYKVAFRGFDPVSDADFPMVGEVNSN